MDALPVVAQLKSFALAVSGDWDGAMTTQDNFSKQCVVISQFRSIVELAICSSEAAKETQVVFVCTADDHLQKTPVFGHARGTLAYMMGDSETGDRAMLEATKMTVYLGAIISAWHIGLIVGATTSVIVGGAKAATLSEDEKKAAVQSLSLDGSCLCIGDCVCIACWEPEPFEVATKCDFCLGTE